MVRPAPLNRPARIGAHRPRILFGWRPGLDYLTVSGYVGATVVEPAGALCMPGSRSDFLARDAQTGARSVLAGVCLAGFLVTPLPRADAARASAPAWRGPPSRPAGRVPKPRVLSAGLRPGRRQRVSLVPAGGRPA